MRAPGAATWEQHEDFLGRYYSEGYERGNWPKICSRLMTLLSEGYAVKYFGDDQEFDQVPLLTPQRVCELSLHFMGEA